MKHPVDVTVGKRIRAARNLAGATQEQLATRLGITFQQIQKYESASNRISASRLYDLAYALSLRPEHFFEHDSPTNPLSLDKASQKLIAKFSKLPTDKQKLVSKLVKDL
jgi:transcriptional regulator with XRE-family HTH domain